MHSPSFIVDSVAVSVEVTVSALLCVPAYAGFRRNLPRRVYDV